MPAGNPTSYWVRAHIPIWPIRPGPARPALLIWKFHSLWTNTLFFNYTAWAIVILAVILVSVACWLPLIRDLTMAISELTRATGRVAEGHFEISLPVKRQDELGKLSASMQQMTQRLSGFVHGQRSFLSDVAHELTSPVARIQAALGILEQRVDGPPHRYVVDALEELQHVSGLINGLLLFSKAQIAVSSLHLEPVNVAATVRRQCNAKHCGIANRNACWGATRGHRESGVPIPFACERNSQRNPVCRSFRSDHHFRDRWQ